MSLNIYVNTNAFHFVINRLSSIDTKYHIWKLGVVLTDNVSLSPHKIYHQCDVQKEPHKKIFTFFLLQSFLYLIWYTTMSIFGHFNNFFFAAHLLDIAMGFKTLRTILSSVTHNGKQASSFTSRGSQSSRKSNNCTIQAFYSLELKQWKKWFLVHFWLIFKKFQNCIKCICFSKQSLSESMIHNRDQTGMKELASWLILNINIIRSWK